MAAGLSATLNATSLPAGATVVVSYDDITFGPASVLKFRCTPRPDSARRITSAVELEFTIQGYIAVNPVPFSNTTSTMIAAVRQKLMRQGGQLTIQGMGLGDLTVNAPAGPGLGVRDLAWGPIPGAFSYDPTAGIAGPYTWSVKTTLPDQCLNPVYWDRPMELCYSAQWSVDKFGLCRRVLSGHVTIPLSMTASDKGLLDNADSYRHKVAGFAMVPGFRRIPGEFNLSEDRRTLHWSVTDEQLPSGNYFPPGVMDATASHTVRSNRGDALMRWVHIIEGKYTITTDRSRGEAWDHFVALCKDRMDRTKKETGKKGTAIPLEVVMSEPEIYGLTCATFRLSYVQSGPWVGNLQKAVKASALWNPAPESDWDKWINSLQKSRVVGVYGTSLLGFQNEDDILLSVCNSMPLPLATKDEGEESSSVKPSKVTAVNPWGNDRPDADESWVGYRGGVMIQVVDDVAELKPLPSNAPKYVAGEDTTDGTNGFIVPYTPSKAATVIAQFRAPPSVYVTVWGEALRAGWAINPPTLLSVGGAKAVPLNRRDIDYFETEEVFDYGVVVAWARWSQTYVLTNIPARGVKAPHNPLVGGTVKGSADKLEGGIVEV